MSDLIHVDVLSGDRAYQVRVGAGARHQLASVLAGTAATAGARRAVVVTQSGVGVVVEPGVPFETFMLRDGEHWKRLATVDWLCAGFARFGLGRRDVVVSVGGGVVSDVAGLAAALYHRGVAVVHVPTTLLAQIDASVGGKTAVNLAEGKNLVGTFWQPAAVLCDTDTLATLPVREMRSGLGELAKYHFVGGTAAERWLSRTPSRDLAELPLAERIAACVDIKAEIVAADETDLGRRAVLNYGHTLAHALETAGGFGLRHGEAVAVGLRYAALLAHRLGRIDDDRVADHDRVLTGYGLNTELPADTDHDELIELFARDKKAGNDITFVLDGPDGLETVTGIDTVVLRETLNVM